MRQWPLTLCLLLLSTPSQGLELRPLRGKFSNSASVYNEPLRGLPGAQDRLDAEAEETASSDPWSARLTPWVWTKAFDARGGVSRKTRAFFELKEGWLEYVAPGWEVRAGNQIIAWGTGDAINPTDVWNPRDQTDLFSGVKLPAPLARIRIHPESASNLGLELIATPWFRPSQIPIALPEHGIQAWHRTDSRWLLPMPSDLAVSGFVVPLRYQVTEDTRPNAFQIGGRMQILRVGGWDFSGSFFSGVESLPRFALEKQGSPSDPTFPLTITLHPSFHRETRWGADGAGSVNLFGTDIGTRFELAYVVRDNARALQAPAAFQADLMRDNLVHGVAGIDYTFQKQVFGTIVYVNLQYVHLQKFGGRENVTGNLVIRGLPDFEPWDRDLILYWENRRGSNFKFVGNAVMSLRNVDAYVAPAVQYKWTDTFETALKQEIFVGRKTGFFGQFHDGTRTTLAANLLF